MYLREMEKQHKLWQVLHGKAKREKLLLDKD